MGSLPSGYSATSPPLLVGDLLVVGVAGGEEGARGFLDAYHASTGERAWRFYTIPKRGEKGSETWMGQALEHGCGATWLTGSYDPQLDLIYWASATHARTSPAKSASATTSTRRASSRSARRPAR